MQKFIHTVLGSIVDLESINTMAAKVVIIMCSKSGIAHAHAITKKLQTLEIPSMMCICSAHSDEEVQKL